MESPEAARAAIAHISEHRRLALRQIQIPVNQLSDDLGGGRILYSRIDTDHCSAATEPSQGFLDEEDLPGWDTWFFHRDSDDPWGRIYCWVPPSLVGITQAGMNCIPAESVQWMTTIDELLPAIPLRQPAATFWNYPAGCLAAIVAAIPLLLIYLPAKLFNPEMTWAQILTVIGLVSTVLFVCFARPK